MAVYSNRPPIKKKAVQDELESRTAGVQEKYLVYSIQIPANNWTQVTSGEFAGLYKQTVAKDTSNNDLVFVEGDVAMIDADDINAERLADYNVVAETYDSGFTFYCDGDEDGAPAEAIDASVVVFPKSSTGDVPENPADLVPTVTEKVTNIESILDGRY